MVESFFKNIISLNDVSQDTVIDVNGNVIEVDESAHGVAHYIKTSVIVFKVIVVSILLGVAIKAYSDRKNHVPFRK